MANQPEIRRSPLSVKTQREVIGRDHGHCRFPGCKNCLSEIYVGQDGRVRSVFYGHMAHIRAASPKGPRYDPDYPREKVNSQENVVSLCYRHHKIVDDNPDEFPVAVLESWIAEPACPFHFPTQHRRRTRHGRRPAIEVNPYDATFEIDDKGDLKELKASETEGKSS
jgi:hypothetical protein